MGHWLPSVKLDLIEFDGDKIELTCSRLQRSHMIMLSPYIDRERGVLTFSDVLKMSEVAAQILPECITKIEGMTIGSGEAVNAESFKPLMSENYFSPLIGEILTRLISASTVRQADAKN